MWKSSFAIFITLAMDKFNPEIVYYHIIIEYMWILYNAAAVLDEQFN